MQVWGWLVYVVYQVLNLVLTRIENRKIKKRSKDGDIEEIIFYRRVQRLKTIQSIRPRKKDEI